MAAHTSKLPSADIVADYILQKIDPDSGDSITNLKLQKLVYYSQAWHLAITKKPLFREEVCAWPHGPVVPELWDRFKKFEWQAIDPHLREFTPEKQLTQRACRIIDEVWRKYGGLSGQELESLTSKEAPWKNTCGNEIITREAMQRYYSAKLSRYSSTG